MSAGRSDYPVPRARLHSNRRCHEQCRIFDYIHHTRGCGTHSCIETPLEDVAIFTISRDTPTKIFVNATRGKRSLHAFENIFSCKMRVQEASLPANMVYQAHNNLNFDCSVISGNLPVTTSRTPEIGLS